MNIIFLIVLVDELKGIALLLALFFVYKFFSKNNINCEKCDKSGPECFQKENLQTVDRSQETLRSYEVE